MIGESNSYTAAAAASSSAVVEGQKSLQSIAYISYTNLYLHSCEEYFNRGGHAGKVLTYIFQFSYV